jgi:hypothetical protein
MRIQNHGLICQTMNHYNQELGILGSNIQVRNSPFKPSSWLHPSTGTTFQTTPASNPIRLQCRTVSALRDQLEDQNGHYIHLSVATGSVI